ncbi:MULTISPECIES: nitroreductase [unclassified Novosphingobium]|uniref:nitroreductase n=1 Tax=unclassified Novosphingobium TaxID=2644732 RepID=UPI0025D79807|nr:MULTISPECIES: nitroreductase [unclassified Novosphingobium]HQV03993.1 nitroreductase [Novosphingobium sp.]
MTKASTVTEAVASRRSIRQYLDQPVDQAMLRRVLEKAQNAPSGGNTQPWNAIMLTGAPLQKLIDLVTATIPQGLAAYSAEYPIYPAELEGRYAASRFGVGEAMYKALDIPREDKAQRMDVFRNNFRAFGAPVLMLVHTPRYMGLPQWSDIGMWLQTVLLLLREEGLDSCAQEAWAVYQKQIREVVDIPEDHIFFCGCAIGWGDRQAAVNSFPVPRVGLDETVRWEGF